MEFACPFMLCGAPIRRDLMCMPAAAEYQFRTGHGLVAHFMKFTMVAEATGNGVDKM